MALFCMLIPECVHTPDMKRISVLLLFLGCLGCAVPTERDAPSETPTPSPSPTPTPVPAVVLYCDESRDETLRDAVSDAVNAAGYAFFLGEGDPDPMRPGGRTCLIVDTALRLERLPIANGRTAVLLLDDVLTDRSANYPAVVVDTGASARRALDGLIAYPNHSEPVRVVGIFSRKDSPAYSAYIDAISNGELFSKDVLMINDESSAADAVRKLTRTFYAGMLDAIFCETGSIAAEVSETLVLHGRDDIEVFAASVDPSAVSAMRRFPAVFIRAEGVLPEEVGKMLGERAVDILKNGGNTEVTTAGQQKGSAVYRE